MLNFSGGVDYAHVPTKIYNFTFPAGAMCASPDASVLIIDDAISENDEAFSIVISKISLPYGIKLGSNSRATVLIEDNDSKWLPRDKLQVLYTCMYVYMWLIVDYPASLAYYVLMVIQLHVCMY